MTLAVVALPGWTIAPLAGVATGEPALAVQRSPAAPARPAASGVAVASRWIEVWIELDIPAVAARPALTEDERAQHLRAIDAQQSALLEQLQHWDAVERGRVRIVRNAVVVEIPESALDDVRQLPGVTAVLRVSHRQRIHPDGPQLR
jgi:hypothetical protein